MTRATAYEGVVLMLDVLFPGSPSELDTGALDAAVVSLERWRRGGLRLAGVSRSAEARDRLRGAGLASLLDVILCEPWTGPGPRSPGAVDLLPTAASRLSIPPGDLVAIVDGVAAVGEVRAAGFGLIVGVGDRRSAASIGEAGVDVQVEHLVDVRFPRRMPSLFDHLDALASRLDDRPVVVCLDYDGTLTPIVDDPGAAWLGAGTRVALERVTERYPVLILSGRDRSDVESRVGLDRVVYAGSHGFDISGLATTMALPDAEAARPALVRAGVELTRRLADVPGVVIEPKRFSVATHYRNVDPAQVEHVRRVVADVLGEAPGLRSQLGKMVIDLRPDVEWDKGLALRWILDALGLATGRELVCYVGDDETDEDVFRRLGREDLGVRVGPEVQATQAGYRLEGTEDVRRWLEWLTTSR